MTPEPESVDPAAEKPAYRLVDRHNHGWLNHSGTDTYYCYQPTMSQERLGDFTVAEIVAQYGEVRPVEACLSEERDALHAAFDRAGRKTICSVVSALDTVFHEARLRAAEVIGPDGLPLSDYDYAVNTLTAGRPGSWEADLLHKQIVWFGNELNLHAKKGTVEERRAAGPHPKRVDVAARDEIADVLRAWTDSPDRYTEVAETLGHIVAGYADERYGADGWKNIADQWLQPGALAQDKFGNCYTLFYGTSVHMDHMLL